MLIDPKSPIPVYQQIVAQLRRRIADGVYKPCEALPSLRVMAADVGVNPNTVQRAYDELAREGLVESRRGAGLFVTDSTQSPAGRCEVRLSLSFDRALLRALTDGVSPERIRTLFREALNNRLERAQKGVP